MSSPSPQASPSKATKPFPKPTAAVVKKQVVVEVKVKEGDDKEDGPKEPEPVKSAAKLRQAEASAKAAYTGPQTRVVFMRDLEAFLKGKGERNPRPRWLPAGCWGCVLRLSATPQPRDHSAMFLKPAAWGFAARQSLWGVFMRRVDHGGE
jgi:hypothetical protein